MNSLNDENKRKVQQKYQKFKSMQLQSLSPSNATSACQKILQSVDQNLGQKCNETQTSPFSDSYHTLLKSIPRTPKILEMMLSDPNIYQFSETLKKQAQQKNMQILISSFPERYKYLLEIQGKFDVLEKQSKEKTQKNAKQTEIFMEKIWKAQLKCKEQEQVIGQLRSKMRDFDEKNKDEYCQIFRKKQQQITDLKQHLQSIQKKHQKLKQDYKNSNTVILQLRDHEQQTQKQTQRLVQKLTQMEQKLSKAHKRLLEYDSDKKLQMNSLSEQHKGETNQLNARIQYLQQLLEQANIRTQYKQSLLNLAEEESQRNLIKLEEELAEKGKQLLSLREEHLEALRTIDQLEERVNFNQETKTRDWGVWCIERQELKKQLDKTHQANGELKAELQVKSQLIKMQQKSIQCLKQTFQSELSKKSSEYLQLTSQLEQAQHQQQSLCQKLQQQQESILKLETHIKKISLKNKELVSEVAQQNKKICQNEKQKTQIKAAEEETLRKYLDIVVEQEEGLCQLRERVQQWIAKGYEIGEGYQERLFSSWGSQDQMVNMKNKVEEYEKVIEKMKKQIISLNKNTRQNSGKGAKIVKQLIEQNKALKKQLQGQQATHIHLFS